MSAAKAQARGRGRGHGKKEETVQTRMSKTLSYVLRHGAGKTEGVNMRPDGYVRVEELLNNKAIPQLQGLTFPILEQLVHDDAKNRYDLVLQQDPSIDSLPEVWWIRANQGHSISTVTMTMDAITSPSQISMAVHGTSLSAWSKIQMQGLSRMTRNHIHFATGLPSSGGVISGMRNSSQILIYLDVEKVLEAGFDLFLSKNGVVLSSGDEAGLIKPEFFKRVETSSGAAVKGWEGG